MEHTKNHEKRPAIFPVKTLESITVTPATLSNMLVNATQNVNLKVIANYMTGTVASTEEVTSTATVTASAGTYAAGVFTAPATAQTVTLTVAFGGKEGTITVVVTAEPARLDTVEVTFPATLAEATTTAAVVVVKDQYGAVMTTGFTTGYAVTTGTSTASSLGVVTAGAYDTGVAANNNHVLTVTVTPTSGTALTKTVNFTVTQDTSKPTITKVEALSNKSFRVTYSKKVTTTATTLDTVAAANALDTYNFKIYNLATGIMAGLVSDAPGNNERIQVTATFADANQTVVNFYITAIGGASTMTGYPNGGFSSGNFIFYASNVKDSAGNTIVANSNYTFAGTLTPDAVAPNMTAASYDTEQGILSLTFDKAPVAVAATDGAKYTITGETSDVALTNLPGSVDGTYGLKFTLTAAQKATVGVPGSTSKVTIAIGGVKDSASNSNTVAQSVALAVNVRPALKTVAYDEATHRLTLTFNKTVKYSDIITNLTSLTLKRTGYTGNVGASSNVITTANSATIVIQLDSTTYSAWEAATVTTPTLSLAADKVSDLTTPTALQNIAITDFAMTYTKDTTVIAVTGVAYDENLSKLTITFNKNINTTPASLAGLEVKNGTTSVFNFGAGYAYASPLAAGKYNSPNPNQLAFQLTTGAAHKEAIRAEYEKVDDPTTLNLLFAVAAGAIKDTLGNSIAASSTKIAYSDNVKPQVTSATSLGSTTLKVVFNEKVDATTAATLANYTIAKDGDTSVPLVLSGTPQILADKVTVFLTTANQATTTWKVTVANVKDLAGNVIDTLANNTATFTGVASSTLGLTTNASNKIVDANNNGTLDSGDYLVLAFSAPVSLKTGLTGTEFRINAADIAAGTAANQDQYVFGSGYSIAKGTGPNEVKITFGSRVTHATDAAWATYLVGSTINTNSGITAANSKIYVTGSDPNIGVTYAGGSANTLAAPTTSAAPKITAAEFTDVNGNAIVDTGDKLKLTFDQKIVCTTGSLAAANFKMTTDGLAYDSDWTVGTDFTGAATGTSNNELTITLGSTAVLNRTSTDKWFDKGAKIQIDHAGAAAITNYFGIAAKGGTDAAAACAAAITPTIANEVTAVPSVVSVTKIAGASSFQVAVKFSEAVYANTAAVLSSDIASNFTFVNGTLTGTGTADLRYGLSGTATDYTTIIITPAAGSIDALTTWALNASGLTMVKDITGNAVVRTSVTPVNVVVEAAPTTTPTVTSVVGTANAGATDDTIKVTFSKAMNVANIAQANIRNKTGLEVGYADDAAGTSNYTAFTVAAATATWDVSQTVLTVTLAKAADSASLPNGKYIIVKNGTNAALGVDVNAVALGTASAVLKASEKIAVPLTATIPTATGATNLATGLVVTFNELLYDSTGAAIADATDIKAKFTAAGGATITSALYATAGKTVTFVLAGSVDNATLVANADALKNAGGVSYTPVTYYYHAGGTIWNTSSDYAAPTLSKAAYQDANADGTIDQIVLTFNKQIAASTVAAGDFAYANGASSIGLAAATKAAPVVSGVAPWTITIGLTAGVAANTTFTNDTLAWLVNAYTDVNGNGIAVRAAATMTDEAAPLFRYNTTGWAAAAAGAKTLALDSTEKLQANAGVAYAVYGAAAPVATFTSADWAVSPVGFALSSSAADATSVNIVSDALAASTGGTAPTVIILGTGATAVLKDIAGNTMKASVTIAAY